MFQMTMRRILIILAILIVLAGCGIGIYFLFFAKTNPLGTGLQVGLPLSGGQSSQTGPQTGSKIATTSESSVQGTAASVLGRLVKISAGPVVPGVSVVDLKPTKATATTTASSTDVSIHYIERESGNIFSYRVGSKTLTRTSNRTVPGLQDATWLPDTSAALVRYLSGDTFSTINTYALPASSEATTTSSGFFLPQNLSGVVVSAVGLLTAASGVNGTSVTLSHLDGTRPTSLFSTPLTAIHVSFAGKGTYLVFSRASGSLGGYAFLVDSAGRFTRIAGPLAGLTALASPSGKWVFLSFVRDGALQTALFNSKNGEIIALPVGTLTEKCAWTTDDGALYCGVPTTTSASNLYPDDWYQGVVHFSDRLWRIDVSGRYAQMILDFQEVSGETLDVTSLALDPAQTTLVFLNKNDGSLWSYSL